MIYRIHEGIKSEPNSKGKPTSEGPKAWYHYIGVTKNKGIKCLAISQITLGSQGGLNLNRPKRMCMESKEK